MALETLTQLERLGFPDLLLWLLTFAIVYGVLSQIKMPKSAASRAIIGIVSGLFVFIFAPPTPVFLFFENSSHFFFLFLKNFLKFFLWGFGVFFFVFFKKKEKRGWGENKKKKTPETIPI